LAPAEPKTASADADQKVAGAAAPFALPDMATLMAVLTLAFCLFVFNGGRKLFRDSDTGWHIRTGDQILMTRALPSHDPYSFSKPGAPWLAWEWGSDVLMGLAHRIDGLRGVTAMFALAIAACTWMWFRLHWAVGGNFYIACAMMPLMINTASLHWLARPHVFSWLFLIGAVWYAERAPFRFGPKQAIAVAAATSLWANLHASFFFAPIIALIFAASHYIRPLIWDLNRTEEFSRARWFLLAAAAALAGSFVNPYGWRLHAHIASYLMNGELLDRVAEFQSFNFHAAGSAQILATLAIAAMGGTLVLTQKNIAHFLLAAMFCLAALRSARALPLVALLILPLANAAFTNALRAMHELRPGVSRWLDHAMIYAHRTLTLDRRLNGAPFAIVAIAALLLALRIPAAAARIGFPPDEFPVAAAAAIEKLPPDARLFAPDKYGGYLIYRFNGARKVYFDGRSDFYGAAFMKQYIELVEVRPGWQEILRSLHFTHALLPNRYSLGAALDQAGWRTIYKDNVCTLLEAR
jgi:hypothetical protein